METHFKTYNCTGCNEEIKVYCPASQYVSCIECGDAFRISSDKTELLSYHTNTHYCSATFIEVGMLATIDAVKYRVLSRLHCIERCYELAFNDNGSQIYEGDYWKYEEYVLQNSNGENLYLIYDEEGYWLNYPLEPDFKEFPSINRVPSYMKLFKDEPSRQIEEHGNVTIDGFAGELDYDPRLDKQLFRYALYVKGDEDFVLEYNAHANETEAFREKQLDEQEVMNFFSGEKSAEKAKNTFSFRKFVSFLSLAAAIFSLLLILISEFGNKEILLEQQFSLATVSDSGFLSQPFYVDETDAVYELTLRSDFYDFKNYEIAAHILNEKENIVNDMDGEFYRESDDEGTYTNHKETEKFRATETGNYFVRVYAPAYVSGNDVVGIKVVKGGMAILYPFLTFIIFGILALLFQPNQVKNRALSEAGIFILIIAAVVIGIFMF